MEGYYYMSIFRYVDNWFDQNTEDHAFSSQNQATYIYNTKMNFYS